MGNESQSSLGDATDTDSESESCIQINQLRSASMIQIPVMLGGIPIEAVVDTAAEVTIISDRVYKELNWTGPIIKQVLLQTAGRELKIKGFIIGPLALQIGSHVYEEEVYVATIEDKMLLGLDFLRRNKMSINLGQEEGYLEVNEQKIPFVLKDKLKKGTQKEPKASRVRVCQRTIIPPNTAKIVTCASKCQKTDYMVEPITVGEITMPRTLHQKNQQPRICMLNLTDRNIVIKANQRIGEAYQVSPITPADNAKLQKIEVTDPSNVVPDHLENLINSSKQNLSDREGKLLEDLILEYQDVFAKDDYDLGEFTEIKHSIITGDAKPVKQRMRKTPLGFVKEEQAHLDKMLKAKVIQPSKSEWASAPVLIRKRDGSVRWCVDYRELNKVTEKDSFPLPLVENCIDTLARNKYFSKLDANSAYWQVQIRKEDQKKTAFLTKYGLFEFVRMPFGLCNAPATYCRVMNLILRGLTWEIVLVFLDDILVLGQDFKSHLENLWRVLQRFREYGLRMKPNETEEMYPFSARS